MYRLSQRSIRNLQGVHETLAGLMRKAIQESPYDFIITEGVRTIERQKEIVRTGMSQTMNSYHLKGKAVDIAILANGKVTWEFQYYKEVADHIKKLAKEQGIRITWGGDWKKLKDGPHFQLEG